MQNKRRVLLTHHDLDGIGCDILLSSMVEIERKYHYGYTKIHDFILGDKWLNYDSIIVTDISLLEKEFAEIYDQYNENFMYIDHHSPTLGVIDKFSFPSIDKQPIIHVNVRYSGTGIIASNFSKFIGNYQLVKLATYIDAYDMWRHKTNPKEFAVGYKLNVLFWKYTYDTFFRKFKNGFSGFDEEDNAIIETHMKERKNAMDSSEMEKFGNNSLFVCGIDTRFVNDYTLVYPEYDIFYLIYETEGTPTIGLRATVDNVKLGHIINRIKGEFDCITSGGGHPKAAGITLKEGTNFYTMTRIVERIDKEIQDGNTE